MIFLKFERSQVALYEREFRKKRGFMWLQAYLNWVGISYRP